VIALPPLRREHAFGAIILVFGTVAAWPWLVAPPLPAGPAPAPTTAPIALAALSPLADFSAIVERPLFAPSRRPDVSTAAAAPAGPGIELRYRLLGVIGIGPDRRALIADGVRRFEVKAGDRLDAWSVTRVEPDRLVLSSPGGETVLKLAPTAKP
jgi:hypothetical protein